MYNFEDHPELFGQPLRYNPEVISPEVIIDDFFSDYSLVESREILWTLFHVAITTHNDFYSKPVERANLFYRCKRMEKLFEANSILAKRNKQENTTKEIKVDRV